MKEMNTASYYARRPYYQDDELCGRITEEKGLYREETLCDQCSGRYFLRIKTIREAPRWKIRRRRTRNWSIKIKELSKEEAMEWVREELGPEAFEIAFGAPTE